MLALCKEDLSFLSSTSQMGEKSFWNGISHWNRCWIFEFGRIYFTFDLLKILSIKMSHWIHKMVDGTDFWINCQLLNLLRKGGSWQLIQNSLPNTILHCLRDIWIMPLLWAWHLFWNRDKILVFIEYCHKSVIFKALVAVQYVIFNVTSKMCECKIA